MEEKIEELTRRIEKLEKEENKRQTKKKLKIAIEIGKILTIIIIILIAYININNKIIKPYKEKIDYVENKVTDIDNFVKEKYEYIKNIIKIPFN